MKKLLALLLVTVMALSLVACGEKKPAVVGTWEYEEEDSLLILNADNTGKLTAGDRSLEITWKYDDTTSVITVTATEENLTDEVTYDKESDIIDVDGWVYVRISK